jgi:hypothetical protein
MGVWASDEKVLCGVLWRGDGRGGVFYYFFHFCALSNRQRIPNQVPRRENEGDRARDREMGLCFMCLGWKVGGERNPKGFSIAQHLK